MSLHQPNAYNQLAKASCEVEPDIDHQRACMPLIYERLGQRKLAEAALATAIAQQGDYGSYQYGQIYARSRASRISNER